MAGPRICSSSCENASEQKTKCFGCKLEFHGSCYNLQHTIQSIGGMRNIQFICDVCLVKDNTPPENGLESGSEPVNVEKLIKEIHSCVKATERKIDLATSKSSIVVATPGQPIGNMAKKSIVQSARRVMFNNPKETPDQSAASLTPARKPLVFGTKEAEDGVVAVKKSVKPKMGGNNNNAANFTQFVFLTRVDAETTCEKIIGYVKKHAGIEVNADNFECIKLVKKGQDLKLLTFCSFKLSTNREIYNKITDSSFWPEGVGFRDFEQNTSNKKRSAASFSPMEVTEMVETPAKHVKTQNSNAVETPKSSKTPKGSSTLKNNDIRNFCQDHHLLVDLK